MKPQDIDLMIWTEADNEDEPNEITYEAMDDAEHGRDMYGPYNSVKELMEALNA